jgi:hypothetical protein
LLRFGLRLLLGVMGACVASAGAGRSLSTWLEERLGPHGAVVAETLRAVEAAHATVEAAGDRSRWLAQQIADLRGSVGDDTVDRLLGDETEAGLALRAIDGAVRGIEAGATEALSGDLLLSQGEDARLADFFARPNGDARDAEVVGVVAAAVLERASKIALSTPMAGVVTAGVDVGVRGVGFEVEGQAATSEAVRAYRPIPGLVTPTPVYEVAPDGAVRHALTLHPVAPFGSWIESHTDDVAKGFFEADPSDLGPQGDLPWFFDPLRPDGFLGRQWLRNHSEAGFPADLARWAGDDVLRFAAHHEPDLPGAWLVGVAARDRWLADDRWSGALSVARGTATARSR